MQHIKIAAEIIARDAENMNAECGLTVSHRRPAIIEAGRAINPTTI